MTFQSWARISGMTGWAVFFLGFCVPGMAQEQPANANSFVIRNARIFDGEKVSSQGDVWVQGGQIKAVGRNLTIPADLKVIDAAGDTLLPGLIDSHTHAWGDALRDALIFGVTTELDMFTNPQY